MDLSWVPQMYPLIVPMLKNLWVHCLVFQLDKILELRWVLLMVLLMVIQMEFLRDKHWQYHLDLLMVKHLALHLDLLMELSSNLNIRYT